jgi:hypothetical protein
MLKKLNRDHAQFVAVLARAARGQRDRPIASVPEAELTEMKPARGEHNPTADLGLAAVPQDAPELMMLREAIGGAVTGRAVGALCADARRGRPDFCQKMELADRRSGDRLATTP